MRVRPINPMSLMVDVFIELERELKCIASLLSGAERVDFEKLPDATPPPPRGTRPKLVKE